MYDWRFGFLGFFVLIMSAFYFMQEKSKLKSEFETYAKSLAYRINKSGERAVTNMPMGIVLYNDELQIEWANNYIQSFFEKDIYDEPLEVIGEEVAKLIRTNEKEKMLAFANCYFQVTVEREEKLIYFLNVTETERMKKKYRDAQPVIVRIFLDNYDEVTRGMEDQVRSRLMNIVTSTLNAWANEHDIVLQRTSSDRFIAFTNIKTLHDIEQSRFDVLDQIRVKTSEEKTAITLSIGVGLGGTSLRKLRKLAQSSLDLALGRGGDQVVIKEKDGKVRFYGGKPNAHEKRTRVRARVISHALRDFVLESEKVVVMGHKIPDMDAIGAALGVCKIAEANKKKGLIVLDPDDVNPDVKRLMDEVAENPHLKNRFITPKEALDAVTEKTLLIVVDTHKPSIVIEPKLLQKAERIIVLDHHRRGEEFIEDPVLVYLEPYASSTAELVTELLEYQPMPFKMDRLEATALLAGITVDTKSFAVRTGARTFDAASFLRSHGADPALVQTLLKEDVEQFVRRAKLIEHVQLYRSGMAIVAAKEEERHSQLTIAQTADTLLTMKDVLASFVIARRNDGIVSISARSFGKVNVQLIMEQLGGGGHLSNAAVQLADVSIEEANVLLMNAIDEYVEGGEEE